jgi:hypothetical protein
MGKGRAETLMEEVVEGGRKLKKIGPNRNAA